MELEITLQRFVPELRFDPVICAEHVAKGKPAPDGLLAIQRMKPGKKLWFVGDTVDDARSAKAAGVPFIGIIAKSHSRAAELTRSVRRGERRGAGKVSATRSKTLYEEGYHRPANQRDADSRKPPH